MFWKPFLVDGPQTAADGPGPRPAPEDVDGHGDGAEGDEGEADDEHVEEVPAVGHEGPAQCTRDVRAMRIDCRTRLYRL